MGRAMRWIAEVVLADQGAKVRVLENAISHRAFQI